MNDLLTEDELNQVADVTAGSPSRMTKIIAALNEANIYYWIGARGAIKTTWHHVHAASEETQQPRRPKTLPASQRLTCA